MFVARPVLVALQAVVEGAVRLVVGLSSDVAEEAHLEEEVEEGR